MWWVNLDEYHPLMTTWIACLLALILVIFVHEMGHYLVALYWRVSVLRFSMGFGKPLFVWKSPQPGLQTYTEFTVNAIPLGGYVKFQTAENFSGDPSKAKEMLGWVPEISVCQSQYCFGGTIYKLAVSLFALCRNELDGL